MKLKQIQTERLRIHRDQTSRSSDRPMEETLILNGLAETFGHRPRAYQCVIGQPMTEIPGRHLDELWLDLDEARELYKLLGAMLEGCDPLKPRGRRKSEIEEPTP